MSNPQPSAKDAWWVLWPALVGLICIYVFFFTGDIFFDRWTLDVGGVKLPRPKYASFLLFYTVFGGVAAGFFALTLARLLSFRARHGAGSETPEAWPDSWWIAGGTIAGAAVPLAIRALVLEGANLTDDETCYQFMGELLASGRLTAPSPPMKEFFDHMFMINDGRLYAMYFVGWPALRVPGEWLGIADSMNAIYSAVTVPPLFLVVRRLTSSRWAKVATVLYVLAPHLMIVAATQMAHTSCIAGLAWFSWFALRARDEGAPWWCHAGVAFTFSVAFFVRPLDALGVGLPLLVYWALGLRDASKEARTRNVVAFLIPALVMASLFLGVNKIQNGSYFTVAYQHDIDVAREEGVGAGTYSNLEDQLDNIEVPHFGFEYPVSRAVSSTGIGLMRLNVSLLGWPFSFLFAFFAMRRYHERLWWASAGFQLALLFFVLDPGIDSFGPPHFTSLGWPIFLLSIMGMRSLTERLEGLAEGGLDLRFVPISLVCGFAVVSTALYLPNRLATLNTMAFDINRPMRAVADAGLQDAVVFSVVPFAPGCLSTPARHFVFWRPNNDPDLENDVLYVNHYSVERDRELMEIFPDRTGYIMAYTEDCLPVLLPLDELDPDSVPESTYRQE